MAKKLLTYITEGPQGQALTEKLEKLARLGNAKDSKLNFADYELLIFAFPDPCDDPNSLIKDLFVVTQKFVAARMKLKSGSVLFLVSDSSKQPESREENGLLFHSIQGGLDGLAKTIAKEYAKRGLNSYTLQVSDWESLGLDELEALLMMEDKLAKQISGNLISMQGG